MGTYNVVYQVYLNSFSLSCYFIEGISSSYAIFTAILNVELVFRGI